MLNVTELIKTATELLKVGKGWLKRAKIVQYNKRLHKMDKMSKIRLLNSITTSV